MKKADIITLVIAVVLIAAAIVIALPASKGEANPLRQREASAALSLEEEDTQRAGEGVLNKAVIPYLIRDLPYRLFTD